MDVAADGDRALDVHDVRLWPCERTSRARTAHRASAALNSVSEATGSALAPRVFAQISRKATASSSSFCMSRAMHLSRSNDIAAARQASGRAAEASRTTSGISSERARGQPSTRRQQPWQHSRRSGCSLACSLRARARAIRVELGAPDAPSAAAGLPGGQAQPRRARVGIDDWSSDSASARCRLGRGATPAPGSTMHSSTWRSRGDPRRGSPPGRADSKTIRRSRARRPTRRPRAACAP